jgi:ribokinase
VGAGTRGRVIVVGSINVDLVMRLPRLPAAGETVLGGVLDRHHGGKGANQAVAAARAGAEVYIVGAVGVRDGVDSVRELTSEGIDVTHIARCDGPTGLAAVLVDESSGENQIAVAPGTNDLVTVEIVDGAVEALGLRPEDVVVLSFELPETPVRLAADLARYYGAQLVVNPAPAQPDRADMLSAAITTPNQHELSAYAPGAGVADRAAVLSRQTGGPVVVTLGPDGALLAQGAGSEHFPGHRVEAVDTTGAGDTLTGVLAASLADGCGLQLSVRRAVAAAALSVTRAGARPGMPAAAAIDGLVGGDSQP